MRDKKAVIVLTDGDDTAFSALIKACQELRCYPLRASHGNPTPLDGPALIQAIVEAPEEPVVVMVDDQGESGQGPGEKALQAILRDPAVTVLGVAAVAANTHPVRGVAVDASVTQDGQVVHRAVDKDGDPVKGNVLQGDTVDVLNRFSGPIVGLGDPGKMQGHDSLAEGVPVTTQAIREILQRSGWYDH